MEFTGTQLIPLTGEGPEDVVLDADGNIYTGLKDGRILRISPDGTAVETIAQIDGRGYGIELYGDSELVVCAGALGLLALDVNSGKTRTLASDGILACNNAAVAADGTIYFSDSSTVYEIPMWRHDLGHQTRTGRLLRRDPDGTVTEILGGLHFANGVALAADESFVIVNATGDFQVHRVWLTGPDAGKAELFASDLSGFPDNASTGPDGTIWVAMASPRVKALDLLQRAPRPMRSAVLRLPEGLQPAPARTVGVLGFDSSGKVVQEFGGEIDGFFMLTAVREHDGSLYFGSLVESTVCRMPLPT